VIQLGSRRLRHNHATDWTVCLGAVYADVLCHCVKNKSLSCASCCSRVVSMRADDDDDDAGVTSRMHGAATAADVETAALSTVLDVTSDTSPCRRRPSPMSRQTTTMTVTVDNRDVIEMHRMDECDDVTPIAAL